jgi:hypothetical protein
MKTIQVGPLLLLFLAGCACRTPIDVFGDTERLKFGVNGRYRLHGASRLQQTGMFGTHLPRCTKPEVRAPARVAGACAQLSH